MLPDPEHSGQQGRLRTRRGALQGYANSWISVPAGLLIKLGMSLVGPGCVKTRMPRPSAQQLDPEGNVGESLLRLRPTSRINISSLSPGISFYTAWTHSGSGGSPIRDTLYRRLQPFRHLHDCSGCFRLGRWPGGTCTHWKSAALPRRTPNWDIWHVNLYQFHTVIFTVPQFVVDDTRVDREPGHRMA